MKQQLLVALLLFAATVVEVHSDVTSDCAGKPTDVVFVLDASNSIWQPDFKRQLNFIKDVVSFFTIGPRNMLVGVITYASYPRLQFHLNSYNRKSDLFAAIENIHQDGGYETKTSAALRYLRERAFSETFGARPRMAQQVAVIITDGRSDNTSLTALEAGKVKAGGVHLFAVGVGRNLDMEELKLLASDPNEYYTFLVDNYVGLERIKDLLAIKTCAVTDPPSTTTTTTTTKPTTTTITTTTTRRQRRIRATTRTPTTPTTSETTTTSSANDNNDDDDDDKRKRGGKHTENGSDKDFYPPERFTDNDSRRTGNENSNHLGESSVTAGQNNVNPSDKITDGGDSHRTGNSPDRAGGGNNKTAGGGIDGSEPPESGKGSTEEETSVRVSGIDDGSSSVDRKSGQDAFSESGGKGGSNRPTIRYENPRTLDYLDPPLYIPDSTQYPNQELKGKNWTHVSGKHPTSDHSGGDGELEKGRRKNRRPGHSTGSNEDDDDDDGQDIGVGIYHFDGEGRFLRVNGSESMVDVDQLPKIPDDVDVLTEGGIIFIRDISRARKIVGCEVNGTHYVGRWIAENGSNWFHGYRAPEIADRLGNGPNHVIDSAEHRITDDSTTKDDGLRRREGGDDVIDGNVAGLLPNGRRNSTDSSDPSGTGNNGNKVVDPNGKGVFLDKDEDGQLVWYLYTCPGEYVRVPDGPPVDENGRPQLNGQSQCTVPDENGQEVDYLYVPGTGKFERITSPNSSSGVVPSPSKDPDDNGGVFEVKGKPVEWWGVDTTGGSSQGGSESGEIVGEDRRGVWTIDVNGTLRPIENELVDLELPKIDEDQDFYVREGILWTKGGDGKLKPVGCIINGTYYVGYWIRKDDGTRMLYGYPSKGLEQKLTEREPGELTHRMLKERAPTTVEQTGDGHWIVDENGEYHWIARVSDDTSNEKQELKLVESQNTRKIGTEDDMAPGQDNIEYTTTPEKEDTGRQGVVVDSNGQTGKWEKEEGAWVWHRYVCPGIYEPVPEGSLPSSSTEDGRPNECTAIDENGELAKYVYQGRGIFVKIQTESGTEDNDDDEKTRNQTGDSKGKGEEEDGDGENNRTKRRSTQVPGSDLFHRKTTSTPFPFETEEVTKRHHNPGSIPDNKDGSGDKISSHRGGCRPRKQTDLAFIIDSKRDDETSAVQMWNLTRDILSKLDLDDDRVQVRFVQDCGPGTGGLNLGEFETKESLINALDARIHAPPTSSAQLIRNMANALSRSGAGRGRRRVGVYLTDGPSDAIEETLAAAQSAKYGDDVEVFAVGVGHGTSPTELRAIASCEVDRHYYAVNHHSKADAIAKKISKVICLGR